VGCAISCRPPDAARPFVGDHAGADGSARGAGGAVETTCGGIDLAEHDAGAVAAGRHGACAFSLFGGVVGQMVAYVVMLQGVFEEVTRSRNITDPAPRGGGHLETILQQTSCH